MKEPFPPGGEYRYRPILSQQNFNRISKSALVSRYWPGFCVTREIIVKPNQHVDASEPEVLSDTPDPTWNKPIASLLKTWTKKETKKPPSGAEKTQVFGRLAGTWLRSWREGA